MDLHNAIIYQIHVRNYSKEGTFAALEKDLKRIKELGVDILYLMPIHEIGVKARKGTYGSPYSVKDYYSIESSQGTLEDLRSLINKTHKLGMKIIIDMVFNHTARDSVLLEEHPEFYFYRDGKNANKVGDWSDIIDLDTSREDTQDYLVNVLKYWLNQGIDGFRFDVVSMVDINVFKKARSVLPSDTIFLAESISTNFYQYLLQEKISVFSDEEIQPYFDLQYNYNYYHELENYLLGKEVIDDFINLINNNQIIRTNCLENHDRKRIASLVENRESLLSLVEFSFFIRGSSFIYMGQEYGIKHYPNFFEKDPVDWVKDEKMYQFYQKIISEKKQRGVISIQNIKKTSDHSLEVTLVNSEGQIFKKDFAF